MKIAEAAGESAPAAFPLSKKIKMGEIVMKEWTRAWTYGRIDAPEDTRGSLKGQRDDLFDYARQMDLEVVGSSQDTGSSLECSQNGLLEMMKAARDGKFEVLLIIKIDCLSRYPGKTLGLLRELERLNIQVFSPLEGQIHSDSFKIFAVLRGGELGVQDPGSQ
ncbi:Site-specific recombinases, DNA invertase Pin homologs [Desulfitobacterium sp. LBE]|uniref:recombinase family protein n=1 Tax=Desulfitobacterium sp. LBE TaxID=884086 RepID=UPI00119A8FE7|nr:recombinase family protein [Desulfitobacterium sp. LBE]TWH59604.1 Site-specific recombinases, DNA invertase Pin homologs [Desulfitobacterium sp. LBE]